MPSSSLALSRRSMTAARDSPRRAWSANTEAVYLPLPSLRRALCLAFASTAAAVTGLKRITTASGRGCAGIGRQDSFLSALNLRSNRQLRAQTSKSSSSFLPRVIGIQRRGATSVASDSDRTTAWVNAMIAAIKRKQRPERRDSLANRLDAAGQQETLDRVIQPCADPERVDRQRRCDRRLPVGRAHHRAQNHRRRQNAGDHSAQLQPGHDSAASRTA